MPSPRTNASPKRQKQTTVAPKQPSSADSNRRANAASMQRAHCKLVSEDWATFADDQKILADKVLPELDEAAQERLTVDRFLTQISDPQLAFSMRQKQPATVDDVVAATLELQSHLKLTNNSTPAAPDSVIAAVADNCPRPQPSDHTSQLFKRLISRVETLEMELNV